MPERKISHPEARSRVVEEREDYLCGLSEQAYELYADWRRYAKGWFRHGESPLDRFLNYVVRWPEDRPHA